MIFLSSKDEKTCQPSFLMARESLITIFTLLIGYTLGVYITPFQFLNLTAIQMTFQHLQTVCTGFYDNANPSNCEGVRVLLEGVTINIQLQENPNSIFTSVTSFSDLPFILQTRTGTVSGIEGLRFSLVEFEQDSYHDDLFKYFGLSFPRSLRSAVVKRRAEYLAGRYAAQQLLRDSGCYEPVFLGTDRAPQWPPGWRGSISHTDQWAIAVISPASVPWRPGIDIESIRADDLSETADLFVTPGEYNLLTGNGMQHEIALLFAFSVKESLYKSLYPQIQYLFGFDAAEIYQIEPSHQRVALRLVKTLTPQFPAGSSLSGYYQIMNNGIVTLVV